MVNYFSIITLLCHINFSWLHKSMIVILQYLACLSTSSSNDKLAFDVGLQEHSHGRCSAITLQLSINSFIDVNVISFYSGIGIIYRFVKHS